MVQIENLPLVLTGLGLTASVLYYTMVLRNANKTQQQQLETRQAQLFMELYREYRDPEFRKMFTEVSTQFTWEDDADFRRKYSPEGNVDNYTIYSSVMSYFEGIGVLVKRGLIGIEIVYDLLALQIKSIWEKNREITYASREYLGMPTLWDDLEYLYDELMKYIEEHPELAP
jgi:hypothetical protein